MAAKDLESMATFLDCHSKRDAVIRTTQFGALFLGGLLQNRLPSTSEGLIKVCSEFSHARLILRLADDIPMLAYTLKCYLSREKSDGFLHWSTLVSNISCLIFYPLEHLAWLADLRLVPCSSERLWNYSLLCWVVYSAIQIVQLFYKLRMTYGKSKELKLKKQKSNSMLLCLGLLKYMCDLLCGLHWMGSGPLSNKLSYSLLGLLGTISSIVQLYHALN